MGEDILVVGNYMSIPFLRKWIANHVTNITVNIMIVNFFQHTEVET